MLYYNYRKYREVNILLWSEASASYNIINAKDTSGCNRVKWG